MIRIGILPQGGQQWIAGVIYIQNILRAVRFLPQEERPTMTVVFGPGSDKVSERELSHDSDGVQHYTHFAIEGRRQKMKAAVQSVFAGHWPQSFESVVKHLKLDAIFPLQVPFNNDFPCPWIGWIPDFQHKHYPEYFDAQELQWRDENYRRLLDRAAHLVVSSHDALEDLKRWYHGRAEKISVLPFVSVPGEEWYQGDPATTIRKFQLPQKFLMFPSQFWTHKNHRTLFEAIQLCRGKGLEDITVVCTGQTQDYRRPEFFESIKDFIAQHRLERNIRILGLIDRQEQIQLMRVATAVVQPSLFEGWSALVEDCRTLGKRIYVSDIAVHREQDPPEAVFFSPLDARGLADRLAADWPKFVPGPDVNKEQRAKVIMKERALEFARNFVSIVQAAKEK